MLNISNIEKIAKILGMDPEEVTEFDIDDASDELDPESEEWLIMIEALRELDGGKSDKLIEEARKSRNNKTYKVVGMVVSAVASFGNKITGGKLNKVVNFECDKLNKKASKITEMENPEVEDILESIDNKDLDENDEEDLIFVALRKALESNNNARKNNKIEWLKIKFIESIVTIVFAIILVIAVIKNLVSKLLSVVVNIRKTVFG